MKNDEINNLSSKFLTLKIMNADDKKYLLLNDFKLKGVYNFKIDENLDGSRIAKVNISMYAIYDGEKEET